MKKLFALVTAGIVGGLMALGGAYFLNAQFSPPSTPVSTYAQPVNQRLNVSTKTNAVPFDFTAAAEKAMPVVVHIASFQGNSTARNQQRNRSNPFEEFFGNPNDPSLRQGSGSGVIISSDGYIVTNNHVVENAGQVEVTLFDNRKFQAEVIGTDLQTDMAVLKIDAHHLPTLQYSDSDNARVGEWVMAVGNPFDLTSTVTAGIISAKGRNINVISGNRSIEAFIQTDAAVNPGNSGGALVDANGKLLGINTAIATRTGSFSGYSFAIPINMVQKITEDIIEYGSFQRAFLGINITELDSDRAEEFGLNFTQGVVIEELIDGGAAQYAGLLPRDVITAVEGKVVKSVPELQEIIGRARVGDTITVSVMRKGKRKEIPIELKAG